MKSNPIGVSIPGLAAVAASLLMNLGLNAEDRLPLERIATIQLKGGAGTLDAFVIFAGSTGTAPS